MSVSATLTEDSRSATRSERPRRAGSTPAGRHGRRSSSDDREDDEARARRILGSELDFVPDPSFDDPAAAVEILGPAPGPSATEPETTRGGRIPAGMPPYLASLYDAPLLTPAQEAHLFRQMNYLKHLAARLRGRVDPARPDPSDLREIERLRSEALALKNRLIAANLRLVVSIVKRYTDASDEFLELVSDGNMALIRSVERFDHARGFKFSTYASWAIMRDVGRKSFEARKSRSRSLTGREEMLEDLIDARPDERGQQAARKNTEAMVAAMLDCLSDRERRILARRFGLNGSREETLEQIGRDLKVTKERVRQIEVRAKMKIRKFALLRQIEPPLG